MWTCTKFSCASTMGYFFFWNCILISMSHSYADEILHRDHPFKTSACSSGGGEGSKLRATTIDFYLSRLPQRRQHFWCAAGFYDTESRHNCGFADLLSCGDADTILINKRHGSQMLLQLIWLWNHRSQTKVYFNEFVANDLRDNMDMIIYDVQGCGGC